jgi:RNA polymerase sigma-70 factor (ECF subfamily)
MDGMSESDSVAVAKVLRGEGDAYRMLVERHSRFVFRLAFRITGNESDAEDVVQDAFLRAFKSLHSYDSRATFSTWLHRIAANCALDLVRKRTRRMETVVSDWKDDEGAQEILPQVPSKGPGTDRIVYSSQVRDKVEVAMQDLSPLERSAFVLRHFEGSSIDEVSTALGVSENAAKQSIFRAVQKLRRALEPVVGAAS